MKKLSALALVVAATFAVGSVQAANVNGFNIFGALGMSHLDDDNLGKDLSNSIDNVSYDSEKNKFAFKLGVGYDFNDYIGLALGYYYLGKAEWDFDIDGYGTVADADLKTQGVGLTANIGYPVTEWFKPYLKAGAGWFHGKVEYSDIIGNSESNSDDKIAPILGLGFQFNLTSNFAITAEYEHIFNAVEINDGHDASYDLFTLGVKYTFGSAAPAPVAPVTTTQRVSETHTLDAGILFPFDGSTLSDEGKQAVADIVAGSSELTNTSYSVYGYTDRLGSDAYNQTLSEKRANAVAAELSADGVTTFETVEGRGKSNPVTGDQCDSVKGKKALIDCLQPDRRVEVQVSGDKTVTK